MDLPPGTADQLSVKEVEILGLTTVFTIGTNTSADLSFLHTMCHTFTHWVEALGATVLSSFSTGLGCTAAAEVRHQLL